MSKFNKEQKIEIYHKWKDENISISQLAKDFHLGEATIYRALKTMEQPDLLLDQSSH